MVKADIVEQLNTYHKEKGPFRKIGAFFNSHRTEIALLIDFLKTADIRALTDNDDIPFDDFVSYTENRGKGHLFRDGEIQQGTREHKSNDVFIAWRVFDAVQNAVLNGLPNLNIQDFQIQEIDTAPLAIPTVNPFQLDVNALPQNDEIVQAEEAPSVSAPR